MANLLFYSEKSLHMGLLILRLLIGGVFVIHGYGFLFGGIAENWLAGELNKMGFDNMGSAAPMVFAYIAAITEFFGGIALILGFLQRLASLGLVITMGVAVWFHIFNGHPFIPATLFPLSMAFIFIGLLITGSGRWSLDAKIFG